MGAIFGKQRRKGKGSAASVLTVEDDDVSDETLQTYPVASPVVQELLLECGGDRPVSARLSVKDHTPQENVELLKEVNPSVNDKEFRNNLTTIRTLYDWDTIPLDFFVDGYVGGEKTRRSLHARTDSRSRAASVGSRIPPALPARRKTRGNSITAPISPLQLARDMPPPAASHSAGTPDMAPMAQLPLQAQAASADDVTARARSRTIASTTVKREARPTDIVTLDTMYTRPSEEFWQNNPVLAPRNRHNNNPPPSPIVSKNLSLQEEKQYGLYVRKSLVVGPDGLPIRRPSVAEGRRRSAAGGTNVRASVGLDDPEMLVPPQGRASVSEAKARRSIVEYSDARRQSIQEVRVPVVDYAMELRERPDSPEL